MYIIEVKNVSKKYRIYRDKTITLKERILFSNRNKFEERQVLDDINLCIEKGKTVGLIGQNGSGKSTLLKLLTRIIYPDKGEIKITGKVSSLLELGAGFHPDFSGRENIYTNASIFGLTRKEIDNRIGKIIEFSELGDYIDNPVRTYSSGMYMRLAFSVAINVDADILLIDEILAVGDANFQRKCNDKIKELKRNGVTIVIVTHDMGAVESICDEAVWIENGKIRDQGLPSKVINSYLKFMIGKDSDCKEEKEAAESTIITKEFEDDSNRRGNRDVEITDVRMLNDKNKVSHLFYCGENVNIEIDYVKNKEVDDIAFGIGIWTNDRRHCYGTNTHIEKIDLRNLKKKGTIRISIPRLQLIEGKYVLDVATHRSDDYPYDYHMNRYSFNIYSEIRDKGIYRPEHQWIIY